MTKKPSPTEPIKCGPYTATPAGPPTTLDSGPCYWIDGPGLEYSFFSDDMIGATRALSMLVSVYTAGYKAATADASVVRLCGAD